MPLDLAMAEILLNHYYVLTKRKVITGTLTDYWNMDTYTMYTLLNWEKEAMKKEEEEMDKAKRGNKSSSTNRTQTIEEDPQAVSDLNRMMGREED